MKNTLDKGKFRYIVFHEDGIWYAVALELNIVVEGDDKVEVFSSLFQAVHGYVASARKFKLRPHLLNQTPDAEYEYLWAKLNDARKERPKKLQGRKLIHPAQVFTFGFSPQAALAV